MRRLSPPPEFKGVPTLILAPDRGINHMSKVRVKGHDLGVDVRSIKQLDIRRKGKKVIVEVLMQAEKSPRQYLMATYEDAIEFYKIVWELRQRSLGNL